MLQALTLTLYASATARSHDVPSVLVKLLSGMCSLAGIDSAGDGPLLVMQSMRQPIRLAITWDMLFDPATMMFLMGGLVWIAIDAGRGGAVQATWRMWIANPLRFALVVLAWLPIRAVLMVALYLHRVALSDPNYPLHVGNQFLSSWVFLAMLAPPVLLAWRFVRSNGAGVSPAEEPKRNSFNSLSVKYLAAAACWSFPARSLWRWDCNGARPGRAEAWVA